MSAQSLIGNALLAGGVTDAAGLARAVEIQSRQGGTLGRALEDLGLAEETVVARTIAAALHLDFLDEPAASTAAALLPGAFCRKRGVVPLGGDDNTLRLAVSDPLDYSLSQDVEFRTGKTVVLVVVTQSRLETMLASLFPDTHAAAYDMLGSVAPEGEVEGSLDEGVSPAALLAESRLPPIVRLVNLILSDAARAGASDVHIEPWESSLQVRHRVDGLLREVLTIPRHLRDQTISRLKIIAGMDIVERRKPQDGRSRLRIGDRSIDLRVSTLPTQFGEKVVVRLLNSEQAILPIDQLGFAPDNLECLKSLLSRPQGMILVTGPTGSGKTSTLYAALNSIKTPTNNIMTLEDPIEFQVPGVNQIQINTAAGVTFASGLRSILRQDPNVVLVGEIRDQETANIAIRAAQTGHLILSTLHTNDAPATITRLFDLGVAPFLVASSLAGIVAQRLVRRPCPSCVIAQAPSAAEILQAGGPAHVPADGRFVAGQGCEKCGHSGVRGRLAIHELLPVTDEVSELIASRASDHAIRKAARKAGMRTLLEDGIEKAAQGLTMIEDVLRVALPRESRETVPGAEETEATPPPAAPAAAAIGPVASESTSAAAGRRRVLVVEDSPTIVTVVKYFLELEGFDVLVAENGQEGLDVALRERPDLIVSDISMPVMGGMQMVKALRADARTTGTRILMLTSESSVESETEGLAAGADDYILKPVEPRRLAARVKALLGRARPAA